MEGQTFGDDGIVTSLGQRDQGRLERRASFACEVRRVTGASQEPLHFTRPLLFLDLDKSPPDGQLNITNFSELEDANSERSGRA